VVDEKRVAVVFGDWPEPVDVLLGGRWVWMDVGLLIDGLVEEWWVVGGRTVVKGLAEVDGVVSDAFKPLMGNDFH
jgi:hypothetical protein